MNTFTAMMNNTENDYIDNYLLISCINQCDLHSPGNIDYTETIYLVHLLGT